MKKVSFAIIGAGWRTEFYLRVARACPALFDVTGLVVRNPAKAERVAKTFDVKLFNSIEQMLEHDEPQFVVTSVPWAANPKIVLELAERNIPVLSETPPATTLEELVELWNTLPAAARVQVAEQYIFQPHHAARLAFTEGGALGQVSQAQVSAAHGYHGISLMRHYLGIRNEPATVRSFRFESPLVEGPSRSGPPEQESIRPSGQQITLFDFGDRLGVIDFSGDQYFSWIRGQRLLVRGERGEIINNDAIYLQDYLTPLRVSFVRHSAGAEGNLEGNYLKGIQAGERWVYRNPLSPVALADDEIAVGTCLLRMAEYVESGRDFYSLAEACQDRYLDLVSARAVESGEAITTEAQPWNST